MHVCVAWQDEPTVILLSGGWVGASVLELKSLWPRLATFSREAVVEYLDIAERGYQRAPNHRRHRGEGIHCGVGHRAAAALFTGRAFAGRPECSHLHLTAHERVSAGGKCGAGDSGEEVGSTESP